MDPLQLGQKLRAARENRGLKQEEAADAIQVPRTAIVHMEAGNRQVSTLELAQLAELYKFPVDFFFASEGAAESDPLLALGRIAPEMVNDKVTEEAIRNFFDISREGAALEVELGHAPRVGPPRRQSSRRLPSLRRNAAASALAAVRSAISASSSQTRGSGPPAPGSRRWSPGSSYPTRPLAW